MSLLAGLPIDKMQFHLPFYRQHQRLMQTGITVSRATLTNVAKSAIELLRPILDAQLDSVLLSRVLDMDETPTRAGHKSRPGRETSCMKTG